MPALKVYGGQTHRVVKGRGGSQVRVIVAASSRAALGRAMEAIGRHHSAAELRGWSETGNDHEIEIATAAPGVVFWCPIDDWFAEPQPWEVDTVKVSALSLIEDLDVAPGDAVKLLARWEALRDNDLRTTSERAAVIAELRRAGL